MPFTPTETAEEPENPATVHRLLIRHGRQRLWELDCATRAVVGSERDRPGELAHVDVKKEHE